MQYRIFKHPCRFFFDSKILFCPRHDVVSYGCHFTVVKHHSNKFRYMYVICNNAFLHWFRFQRYRINIDSTVVIETFHFKLRCLNVDVVDIVSVLINSPMSTIVHVGIETLHIYINSTLLYIYTWSRYPFTFINILHKCLILGEVLLWCRYRRYRIDIELHQIGKYK